MLLTIKKQTILLSSVASLFLLCACQYKDKTNVRDDVLVYCSEGSPETFNPQLSTSGVTFDATSRTLYNQLVELKSGTTQIKPALAKRWSISKDGKEYTFYLRRNVEFHTTNYFTPSRTFNADDVLFSFEKQWLKNHSFHKTSAFKYRYFESVGLGSLIKKIEKINSHTIKFHLNRAESPFLAILAMDFASILSAEYADNLAQANTFSKIDRKPIGTGPFQLEHYQPDAFIRYKAHPLYWNGMQKVKKLVFAITPDASLRFARIIAKECDVMASPLPIHLISAKNFEHTQVISEQGLNIAFLSLNNTKPPFDNLKVRQALNYAINKDLIIKAVYQKTAIKAVSVIPPNMWAHDKNLKDYEYNPQKARQLLKEAGFEAGFKMSLWSMSAQRSYNPNAKKMSELIQQNLSDVNIDVKLSSFEYGTFLKKIRNGEHQSALAGWIADNGDPYNFFSALLTCNKPGTGTNSSFWCDPNFDNIIQQARIQDNKRIRKRLYKKAQTIFKDQAPWVPIAHSTQSIILNKRVKGFKIPANGGVYFAGIVLEKSTQDKR